MKVILIADFSKTGGTLTYFKQIAILLNNNENIDLLILLKKTQIDKSILEFVRDNDLYLSTYRIPNVNFKRLLGSRINHYLSIFSSFGYLLTLTLYYRANFIIQSTGGSILFNLFLLPTKVLTIQHSLQQHKLDRINCSILANYLSTNKRIITVSKFARNCLVNSFNVKGKKETFCDFIYNSHQRLHIRYTNVSQSRITILTLGHVENYKNPEFFLEVAKKTVIKYNNIDFVWAGNGSILEKYQALSKDYINIHFIGHQDSISDLYANSDIYYQPSLLESHGISILGAMAAKKPCVVANVGGMPESVVHNQTGFVYESNNLDEAIKYIEQLINDETLRKQMGNKGFERYQQLFSPEVWEQNMNNYLKEHFNV